MSACVRDNLCLACAYLQSSENKAKTCVFMTVLLCQQLHMSMIYLCVSVYMCVSTALRSFPARMGRSHPVVLLPLLREPAPE